MNHLKVFPDLILQPNNGFFHISFQLAKMIRVEGVSIYRFKIIRMSFRKVSNKRDRLALRDLVEGHRSVHDALGMSKKRYK